MKRSLMSPIAVGEFAPVAAEPPPVGRRWRAATGGYRLDWIRWRSVLGVATLIVVWQALWLAGIIPQGEFPSLFQTLRSAWTLLTEPLAGLTLSGHAGASLIRWASGVLLAFVVGIPFGACLAWFPRFRAATYLPFEFLRYIPPLAWVPLTIMILGPSLRAEAFIVFVGAVPPVIINVWTGVARVDPILVSAAKTLGASSLRTLVTVVLPAASLSVFTGMRIAVANGWGSLIGAELVGAQTGLGFLIITSETNRMPDDILTGMLAIGLIGATIDFLFRMAIRRITHWQGTNL